jgi:hypothetical protein
MLQLGLLLLLALHIYFCTMTKGDCEFYLDTSPPPPPTTGEDGWILPLIYAPINIYIHKIMSNTITKALNTVPLNFKRVF